MEPKLIAKVILVKDSMAEFEDFLNDGWTHVNGWHHPEGCIMVLSKVLSVNEQMLLNANRAERRKKGKK